MHNSKSITYINSSKQELSLEISTKKMENQIKIFRLMWFFMGKHDRGTRLPAPPTHFNLKEESLREGWITVVSGEDLK